MINKLSQKNIENNERLWVEMEKSRQELINSIRANDSYEKQKQLNEKFLNIANTWLNDFKKNGSTWLKQD